MIQTHISKHFFRHAHEAKFFVVHGLLQLSVQRTEGGPNIPRGNILGFILHLLHRKLRDAVCQKCSPVR